MTASGGRRQREAGPSSGENPSSERVFSAIIPVNNGFGFAPATPRSASARVYCRTNSTGSTDPCPATTAAALVCRAAALSSNPFSRVAAWSASATVKVCPSVNLSACCSVTIVCAAVSVLTSLTWSASAITPQGPFASSPRCSS